MQQPLRQKSSNANSYILLEIQASALERLLGERQLTVEEFRHTSLHNKQLIMQIMLRNLYRKLSGRRSSVTEQSRYR